MKRVGIKARKEKEGESVEMEKKEVKDTILGLNLDEKQIMIFLLEFLAVAVVFLAVWYYIGGFYQGAIFFVAKPILLAMGCPPALIMAAFSHLEQAGGYGYLANFNLVPLVALAIATPKLVLRRRIEMLAIGVPVLFLLHVLDLVAHYPMDVHHSEIARLIVYSIGIGGVAIPFIIWFAICYREFFKG